MVGSSGRNIQIPFIIHCVKGRYLIYEPHVLQYLREVHHMCGVLIGTLPQIAQQNVFLGLPLELMVVEAAYLVRHRHAYIVDDHRIHRGTVAAITNQQLEDYRAERLREQAGRDAAGRRLQLQKKREALMRKGLAHLLDQMPMDDSSSVHSSTVTRKSQEQSSTHVDTASAPLIYNVSGASELSNDMISPTPNESSYDLFVHLHDKEYFLTPGLRFGAQFVAYPGDPLRFHSHFVASGHDWESEIPVMDIVVGGRLGTGVKKAWLIGGKCPDDEQVKCFTVEWAGM